MEEKTESRIKHTSKNMLFSIILYTLKILLGFASRTIFIYFLSKEYLGVNSLFSNILTLLSLAELGFGNAIIFSMYKPIAEKDDEKVRQLLSLYKKFYTTIAIGIALVGGTLTPFIHHLINGSPNVDVNLYIVYLIFLTNTVCSYLFSYRKALLITNQRQDIESKISIVSMVSLHAIQILLLAITKNYYLYIICTVILTLFEGLTTYIVTNKLYPNLVKNPQSSLSKEEQKTITKNVFALFFHKLEYVFVFGTDNIIISAFLGVSILGVYSNYAMIISYVATLISFFGTAVRGSLGNYVAVKTPQESEDLFYKINFAFMWIVSWCTICLCCLFQPFINVWLDESYLLPLSTVFLLSFSFYFSHSRDIMGLVKESAGIFWQDRFKALFVAIINIASSIILCKFIGLNGIVIGTILSTVLIPIWMEPYYVYKIYFKSNTLKYFGKYIFNFLITCIFGAITFFICHIIPIAGFVGLLIKILICIIVPNVLYLALFFKTNEFKYLFSTFKKVIKKSH